MIADGSFERLSTGCSGISCRHLVTVWLHLSGRSASLSLQSKEARFRETDLPLFFYILKLLLLSSSPQASSAFVIRSVNRLTASTSFIRFWYSICSIFCTHILSFGATVLFWKRGWSVHADTYTPPSPALPHLSRPSFEGIVVLIVLTLKKRPTDRLTLVECVCRSKWAFSFAAGGFFRSSAHYLVDYSNLPNLRALSTSWLLNDFLLFNCDRDWFHSYLRFNFSQTKLKKKCISVHEIKLCCPCFSVWKSHTQSIHALTHTHTHTH